MLEALNNLEIRGVGTEIVTGVSLCIVTSIILTVLYFTWTITCRRPLEFEMFLVEMHTMEQRRIVEVLHIGSVNHSVDNFGSLLRRVRSRARNRRAEDGDWIAVSDTNVVIQSPATVTRPSAQVNTVLENHGNLTLWEIEIPHDDESRGPNASRDGQIAAAAAISVLGRPMQTGQSTHESSTRTSNFETRATTQVPNLNVSFSQSISHRSSGVIQLPAFHYHAAISLASVDDILTAPIVHADEQNSVPVETPVDNVSQEEETVVVEQEAKDEQEETHGVTSAAESYDRHNGGVQIRLKFLDDSLIITRSELSATVLQFRSANFASAVSQRKVVRLIFKGQLMRDDSRTLESYGLHDDCIVHCHISNTPYAQPNQQQPGHQSVQEGSNNDNGLYELPIADRVDQWFLRAVLSFFTNQLTLFPAQIRHSFVQFVHRHIDRIRPSNNPSFLARTYRRWYEYFIVPLLEPEDPVASASAAAARNTRPFCIGNFLLWIFGVQCAVVWSFVYYFPQLCDRTALGLLLLLTLYFFFVVVPMPRRLQLRPQQH